MEPQSPQPIPINNGGVVTSGTPGQSPQVSPMSSPGRSKKKWLVWLVVLIVVVGGGIGGAMAYKKHHDNQKKQDQQKQQQEQKQASTKPNFGNIKVGSFRYVNACQALSYNDQYKLFAGISKVATLDAKYAENGLPVADIPSDGVESTCSRVFGSDTPYSGTGLVFTVKQYPTTAAAKKQYDTLNVSQAELDKGNKQFGTNFTTQTVPLAGAENTIYDPTSDSSYTLVDNKLISFSALLVSVSADQFKQAIVCALPTVVAHVKDPNLKQELNQDPDFGKKIGTSTFMQACQFFTADDFKAMTGTLNNPMNIDFTYNYASPTIFFKDNSSGDANDACTRTSYPGTKLGQSVAVEVEYFQSADEANQAVQAHMAKLTSAGDLGTVQPVSGVGTYAAYIKPTSDSGISYFYVQKGPYALKMHANLFAGWGSKKYPTAADYTKQANVLLSKLK